MTPSFGQETSKVAGRKKKTNPRRSSSLKAVAIAGIGLEPTQQILETNLPELLKEESKLCSDKQLTEDIIEMVDLHREETKKIKPQPKSNSSRHLSNWDKILLQVDNAKVKAQSQVKNLTSEEIKN